MILLILMLISLAFQFLNRGPLINILG